MEYFLDSPLIAFQAWLTRDERVMASRINMTYNRPEQFKPTCGTSDPGVMQVECEIHVLVTKLSLVYDDYLTHAAAAFLLWPF